jgi:hypothetical protein
VEDAEFVRYIQMLCPGYHIPSKKTLSDSLMPIFDQTTVRKVKAKLDVAAGVCLIAVGWISVNDNTFLTLNAHCLGEDTNDIFQLTYTHTFCGVKSLPEGQQDVE